MEFRDLKKQYQVLKEDIDQAISKVIEDTHFIMGEEVKTLEKELSEYVGTKECITCANGTDALQLALMAWNIGVGDAVFVPDFTFFSSGEVVSAVGATPIFVNVDKDTYNICVSDLEEKIEIVKSEGKLIPKVIIAVDLFGLPADYESLRKVSDRYGLLILEDGAQGFGGEIEGKKACSFGDIATTSFFPAKPLGCYGDGGAIFTNNAEWAELIRSYRVHGKGNDKYDNVRIGMNSRLDTVQAAVLRVKLKHFVNVELASVQEKASWYNELLCESVKIPMIPEGYISSYAQYTICFENVNQREHIKEQCSKMGIPTAIYYSKPMHLQGAFSDVECDIQKNLYTQELCDCVLALPFHPYLSYDDVKFVCDTIKKAI